MSYSLLFVIYSIIKSYKSDSLQFGNYVRLIIHNDFNLAEDVVVKLIFLRIFIHHSLFNLIFKTAQKFLENFRKLKARLLDSLFQ